jgi:hypothetical protein
MYTLNKLSLSIKRDEFFDYLEGVSVQQYRQLGNLQSVLHNMNTDRAWVRSGERRPLTISRHKERMEDKYMVKIYMEAVSATIVCKCSEIFPSNFCSNPAMVFLSSSTY